MKIPTIFFGASAYVLPVIAYLHTDFDLKLVVTTEQKPTDAVPTYCIENGIPYISLKSFKDEHWQIDWKLKIENWKVSFAVLADFGLLVPQSVIDMFPKGITNIHPSLLPIYRGPTPGMTALLHGDTTTGISIMLLDKDLDHGPVIGQISTDIKPNDTSATLYPRLFIEGTELLKTVLPGYLEGKIHPVEQDHTKATFTEPHLTKESGFVEFHELSTLNHELFERKTRAYFPWPTLWTRYSDEGRLNGKIIKFLPNTVIASKAWQSLPLKEKILLQVEGKNPQTYKDFLNGYPETKEFLHKLNLIL